MALDDLEQTRANIIRQIIIRDQADDNIRALLQEEEKKIARLQHVLRDPRDVIPLLQSTDSNFEWTPATAAILAAIGNWSIPEVEKLQIRRDKEGRPVITNPFTEASVSVQPPPFAQVVRTEDRQSADISVSPRLYFHLLILNSKLDAPHRYRSPSGSQGHSSFPGRR
jgi:hypothetical protein